MGVADAYAVKKKSFQNASDNQDDKTYLKISKKEVNQFIAGIQNKLKGLWKAKGMKVIVQKKSLNFNVKNLYIRYSTILYGLENPQKPDRRASNYFNYNYILTPVSFFEL